MIGAALIVVAAQAAAPPAGDAEDEIVVVARRLDSVRVSVGRDPEGKWHCGMDGSSGVLSLDKQLCKAVTTCVRKGAVADPAIKTCVADSKSRLLQRFARERAKRR